MNRDWPAVRLSSSALDAGQMHYVRLSITIGLFLGHVYGELVDEKDALEEMESTHYTGPAAGK